LKFSLKILTLFILIFSVSEKVIAQSLTSSPYSRYGIGEVNPPYFANLAGMGGAFIATRADTNAPIFLNVANPAAIAYVRYTTLELGGFGQFTNYSNSNTTIKNKTANFSYGALGFPLRQRGAACFGVMPYSNVGYNLTQTSVVDNVGSVIYNYTGEGGINRAFIGLGLNPFKSTLIKFYRSGARDTAIKYNEGKKFKRKKFGRELLSETNIGGKMSYLFGGINHTSDVIYPGSILYYNTKRVQNTRVADIAGDFGIQTAFNIDSIGNRELRQKVKVGIGYYISLPSVLNVNYNSVIYNYNLNAFGDEIPKDTILNVKDKKSSIKLPLEQGIGFNIKKGEKLSASIDLAYTNWQQFRYLDNVNDLRNSYRVSLGLNYVPNKFAAGNNAYIRRMQYRIGATYSNGFLDLKNTPINNYAVTVGLGLPVGIYRQFSVVNLSAQFGQTGSVNNGLIREKYIRIVVGFTFNDVWFKKFRYD
jgi:hypothetical protein